MDEEDFFENMLNVNDVDTSLLENNVLDDYLLEAEEPLKF